MYWLRLPGDTPAADQEATSAPIGCCGRRRTWHRSLLISDTYSVLRMQEDERKGGKKGRLLGIISLSDVLRYLIGEAAIGEVVELLEEPTTASTPTATQGQEEAQTQTG